MCGLLSELYSVSSTGTLSFAMVVTHCLPHTSDRFGLAILLGNGVR
jgi:hypothetical protein